MNDDPYNAFLHLEPHEGGFAVGVKDVIDVAGMPTTAASKILHRVPERDADCVARLRAAGATIVGKLNTHEFAYGALTNSPHFGPALNPWNPAHTTAARAAAAARRSPPGLVDVALGTDTAGSVRIPAAFCGVTGHRPSARARPERRRVPDRVEPRHRRAARALGGGVPATSLEMMADRSLEGAAARPADRRRHEPVRARGARGRRGVRGGAAASCPGTLEPVAIPLHEEIATITQLIMLPEATARAPAVAPHPPRRLRRPTSARGCSRASSCRRPRTSPGCARAAGCATSSSARSAATTCSWRRRCRSRRRVSTRSRRTTGC